MLSSPEQIAVSSLAMGISPVASLLSATLISSTDISPSKQLSSSVDDLVGSLEFVEVQEESSPASPQVSAVEGIKITASCSVAMEPSEVSCESDCELVMDDMWAGTLEPNNKLGECVSSIATSPSLLSLFALHVITMGTSVVGESPD